MSLEDLNIMSAVAGVCGGLLGVFIAGSMMPESFVMKFLVFISCTVVCYFVFDKIIEG